MILIYIYILHSLYIVIDAKTASTEATLVLIPPLETTQAPSLDRRMFPRAETAGKYHEKYHYCIDRVRTPARCPKTLENSDYWENLSGLLGRFWRYVSGLCPKGLTCPSGPSGTLQDAMTLSDMVRWAVGCLNLIKSQGLCGSCYDFAGQQLSHQGIAIADSCLSPSVHMQSAVELDPGMLIPMWKMKNLWKLTARTPWMQQQQQQQQSTRQVLKTNPPGWHRSKAVKTSQQLIARLDLAKNQPFWEQVIRQELCLLCIYIYYIL